MMQSAPTGRRHALIPGSATPSPDQAQRLLERTIDHPLGLPPLGRDPEAPTGEGTAHAFNSETPSMDYEIGEPSFPWTCDETLRQQNGQTWVSGNKNPGERALERSIHEKTRRRSSLRAFKAQRGSLGSRRPDKKRKHPASVQEHGRRGSCDVSEDIPHMSEIDPDNSMTPAYKDVFERREHTSLMKGRSIPSTSFNIQF
ncbi:MAG: hypothetical protein LQ347_002617 [Umbilicaria vellea]|nr:MAG: hypothetical protein LQ347_002617 [Umbilicaria vellea]